MEISKNISSVHVNKLKTSRNAQYYYTQGVIAYQSNKKQEAEKYFSQAIQVENDNAMAYYNRGTYYYNEGKYKFAIDDFKKAIKLKPNFAEAHYNLACSYVKILSFREAIFSLKKAISFDKKLAKRAEKDKDFENISQMKDFEDLIMSNI
ncbi:MAG: hypothetical protein KatS3mg068_2588 [Candidatus Sericytochromatia bacterium]|nr:MAG: hypothetical protein KatS3mg068_2588 [Candidatus Sericytochromatia bacterium]